MTSSNYLIDYSQRSRSGTLVFYCLLLLLTTTSCGPSKADQLKRKVELMGRLNKTYIPQASAENLSNTLAAISNDGMRNRGVDSEGLATTATFLQLQLSKMGLKGFYNGIYTRNFTLGEDRLSNVAAILPGSDGNLKNEIVLLSANYDNLTVEQGRLGNDYGVAGLLEIARILDVVDFNRRTVVILFPTAGYQGNYGLEMFSRHLESENKTIYAAININLGQNVVGGLIELDQPEHSLFDSYLQIKVAEYPHLRRTLKQQWFMSGGLDRYHIIENICVNTIDTGMNSSQDLSVQIDSLMLGILALVKGEDIYMEQ